MYRTAASVTDPEDIADDDFRYPSRDRDDVVGSEATVKILYPKLQLQMDRREQCK